MLPLYNSNTLQIGHDNHDSSIPNKLQHLKLRIPRRAIRRLQHLRPAVPEQRTQLEPLLPAANRMHRALVA